MQFIFRLHSFVRPYRNQALLALVLLATLVSLDLAIPRLIERIIDRGIHGQNQTVVIHTGLLMLGISLVSMGIAVGNNILSVRVGEGVARDLRDALFTKIQAFSFGNLDNQKTGRLMVRLTSDTGAVQRLVQMSLRIGTRAPLLMIGSLILMVNTSPKLALTMAPLLLVTMAVIVFFIFRMEPLFRLVQQKFDRLNTILQENVAGVRLIKAFVRSDYEKRRFAAANEEFTRHSTMVAQFLATMSPLLTICVNIGMVIVIWAGGIESARGGLTVGQIVAFTNYLLTTMTPLLMMGRLANVWAGGIASAGRIYEVLDTLPEVSDRADSVCRIFAGAERIVFEDVTFRYGGGEEPVLNGIDLVIEPGETVAFLGATGAGKSTLIHLIPRFYDVSDGRITLAGVDIRQLRQEDLLATIGVVPQESVLFSGSVRDNIRYGLPEATDDRVESAARAAQAHDFIQRLPQGYDTHVEERGINLSGGQKQRIAIARALLTQPSILILDDCTSAVDAETEGRIHQALAQAQGGSQTRLIVAQRISTVLRADRIVVIDRGRIVAQGTHRQLLQTSRIYQEIYDSQLGGGNGLTENPSETHREAGQ